MPIQTARSAPWLREVDRVTSGGMLSQESTRSVRSSLDPPPPFD
jgi:hypothetical protein